MSTPVSPSGTSLCHRSHRGVVVVIIVLACRPCSRRNRSRLVEFEVHPVSPEGQSSSRLVTESSSSSVSSLSPHPFHQEAVLGSLHTQRDSHPITSSDDVLSSHLG